MGYFPLALHPAVRLLVPDQVRALREGLSALAAGVGALAGVRPLVPDEMGALAEGFAAVRTGRAGPRCGSAGAGDGRAVVERPPAVVAHEGSLPGVHPLELPGGRSRTNAFPAVPARVGLSRVDLLRTEKYLGFRTSSRTRCTGTPGSPCGSA